MSATTIPERLDALVVLFGSLRAVAGVTGLDVGYLSRLRNGHKVEPSAETLKRLGLRRVVTYERVPLPPVVATPLRPRTKSA